MMLSSRFQEALIFATELHAQQVRKGSGVPYIAHLLGVASLVLEYGGNEDEAIAALLHDAIEDQGGTPTREEIRRRFGDNITAIVDGCTDSDVTPKPPWLQRKEAYIAHIPFASPSVKLVSIADKIYNVRSMIKDYQIQGEKLWQCFHGGKDGTLWYYQTLVVAFEATGTIPILEVLKADVAQLIELVTQGEYITSEIEIANVSS